jgi:hypothetical protein
MDFYTGMHQPCDAHRVPRAFVSRNRLRGRKSSFPVNEWIMDSAAFTQILRHGGYTDGVEEYAAEIKRWSTNGKLLAAVAQDYMCEAHMLKITGLTIPEHQRLTVERYEALIKCGTGGIYVLPVLQGYAPEDYVRHIAMYGDRLKEGMWVGVGSVCKRNGDPAAILRVLQAIKDVRPDLRLHGFGLKSTALSSPHITSLLHTADSMAWSFAARREGRNANDWREAQRYTENIHARIYHQPAQRSLF